MVKAKTLDLPPSNETSEIKMPQANFHDENEVTNETLRTTQRPSRKNGVHSKKSSLKNRYLNTQMKCVSNPGEGKGAIRLMWWT